MDDIIFTFLTENLIRFTLNVITLHLGSFSAGIFMFRLFDCC